MVVGSAAAAVTAGGMWGVGLCDIRGSAGGMQVLGVAGPTLCYCCEIEWGVGRALVRGVNVGRRKCALHLAVRCGARGDAA
jgi:hypothetical protein